MAARPPTLTAAVAPVLVGTAAAAHDGHFKALPFFGALLAALLIQVGTNLANDVSDFQRGADVTGRLGPLRVTQAGLVSPQSVQRATVLTFAAAGAIGLYLVSVGGIPILLIGVLSVLAGITYTGGPWPFGYHGLGDLFVFVFFGLAAVLGSAYLQGKEITSTAVASAIPIGLTVTAILVINNLRDVDSDRQAGKRTLAVILGPAFARGEFTAQILGAYLLTAAFAAAGLLPWLSLLSWITLPIGILLVGRILGGAQGRELNLVLKGVARLHLLFGLLLAGGLAI